MKRRVHPPAPQEAGALSPAELLARLRVQGGRVFTARLTYLGRVKGQYALVARGDLVRVTGPDGVGRDVDEARYTSIFDGYAWQDATPTGELTDLGPLFDTASTGADALPAPALRFITDV